MAVIVTWQETAPDEVLLPALRVLAAGGVVACPTETFYALAVDALRAKALQRLLKIKARPVDKALLVLVADQDMVAEVAEGITPLADQLMAQFWPGPLTLILPARPGLPLPLTGGTGTIGVRQSGHPLARRLCELYGRPLTGTSANVSGQEPLSEAAQVEQELGKVIDLILTDGRPCAGGLPSTILNVVQEPPRLIRAGAIKMMALAERLGKMIR
jgi:L-threonylcarbamoyladenylate synthase